MDTSKATAPHRRRHACWNLPALAALLVLAGCNGGQPDATDPHAAVIPARTQDLAQARAQFQTHLVKDTMTPDGPAQTPPKGVFELVRYPSPVGELAAYVTPDPGDGKRHPAVVWAHGGYGDIGDFLWEEQDPENDQSANAFREAGLVVMAPSWRQENDNPGRFEMFYGEVEDLHAAREYLATLPYVDPERIYLAGHSTGGTMTLLAAELHDGFRAAFSLGGIPDLKVRLEMGPTMVAPPFDLDDPQEYALRSPARFAGSLKSPTFYFEGEKDYWDEFDTMQRDATAAGRQFKAFPVPGGDHFSIIAPITRMVAKKIVEDTGPQTSIAISKAEVAAAMNSAKQ